MKMKPVFSDAQEKELLDYILVIESLLQGITTRDVRYLAYYMAERSRIPHNFNKATGLAGRCWFTKFKQRHPQLELSIPDASLLSREKAFSRRNVGKFVDLAESVLKTKNVQTHHFSTCDEGSLNTIQNEDSYLCKHNIFDDVGIAVKMQLDEDGSASSSSFGVPLNSAISEVESTNEEASLMHIRHEDVCVSSSDTDPLQSQLDSRIEGNTSASTKQCDDISNSCMQQGLTQEDTNVSSVKSEVDNTNVLSAYNPLPLVPVVFIKEEIPDHDSRSISIKEEPFSISLNEEGSSAGSRVLQCAEEGILASSSLSSTDVDVSHDSPLASSSLEEFAAGRLRIGSIAVTPERTEAEANLLSPHGGHNKESDPAQHSSEDSGNKYLSASCSELGAPKSAEHSETKTFQCSQCKFSTAYKGTLQRHIKVQHSTTKPYECPLCEYMCADKRYLKTHTIARHSDVRPFKCTQCDYSSTTNTHLKQHIMVKHLGVKPFQCSQCKFSSGNKSNLERHTLVKHSNIKPFQCPDCEYSSYDKSNFKRHFLSKHPGFSLPQELLGSSKKVKNEMNENEKG